MKKLITSLAILIPLLLTACKEAEKKAPVKPDYDFQYQDFYSQYIKKIGKEVVIFYPQDIQKSLGISYVPKEATGQILVRRIDVRNYKKITNPNFLMNKQDAIRAYENISGNRNREKCDSSDEYTNLFCIKNDYPHLFYFYLPEESKNITNIDIGIILKCNKSDDQKQCEITRPFDGRNNLIITIRFHNPQNLFYIMPYVENYFYQTTGVHLWHTLPQQS